jgi:glyoxylase-like metal-dependent hydrolase (beta-lactamase superfamily II)
MVKKAHLMPLPHAQVRSITLPLPFRLKAVNLYLLQCHSGHVLIDAGVNTPQALDALDRELRRLGVPWESIHTLFITHYHSDHCGLAATVRERSGATVYMSREDCDLLDDFFLHPEMIVGPKDFYIEHGMPEKTVRKLDAATASLMELILPFRPDRFYRQGEEIAQPPYSFMPIHTPGHTVGHTCLWEQTFGLLFAGDHVLGEITPNIAAHPANPLRDPLHSYLDSLAKLAPLKDVRTLPAHGPVIECLQDRISAIRWHHKERKRIILDVIKAGPVSAHTISSRIFPDDLDLLSQWMAFFETLAHLVTLESEGCVKRAHEGPRTAFSLAHLN